MGRGRREEEVGGKRASSAARHLLPLTSSINADVAICIRAWDWSETSQTVLLFSREYGLIRGVAKGAKREKSRFSGGFEAPSRGHIQFSSKPAEGLTLLTAWDLMQSYYAMRCSLRSFHSGMAMVDLVQHALDVSDPHAAIFDALESALSRLGDAQAETWGLLRLIWTILDDTGHRPELEVDVGTGEPLADNTKVYGFSSRLGGLVADQPDVTTDRDGGAVWRVRAGTVALLRQIAAKGSAEEANREAVARATRLLTQYYAWVFRVQPLLARIDLPSPSFDVNRPRSGPST
jgi:DNA repair protein RecO